MKQVIIENLSINREFQKRGYTFRFEKTKSEITSSQADEQEQGCRDSTAHNLHYLQTGDPGT